MENNYEQKDINELIKEIDKKLEEIKSNPAYDEKEGKEQINQIYEYIKKHPQATNDILTNLKEKIENN